MKAQEKKLIVDLYKHYKSVPELSDDEIDVIYNKYGKIRDILKNLIQEFEPDAIITEEYLDEKLRAYGISEVDDLNIEQDEILISNDEVPKKGKNKLLLISLIIIVATGISVFVLFNENKEFNKHSAEIKIDEWINIVKKNCTEEGFEYKDIKDYQRTADFNGDGLVDYLLWEGGVICDGRTGGYFGNAGPHITFLISSGNGYNFHEGFSFFELSELPISKENGLDIIIIEGTQYGKPIKVKWKWNGNTIKIQN